MKHKYIIMIGAMLSVSLLATSSTYAIMSSQYVPAGYQYKWGDEFDGGTVDETKWSYWNWGQGGATGRQNASADSDHIYQKDGVIHFVTTQKSDGTVVRPVSISQTVGGNIPRKVKGAIKYGYIEMRMKAKLDDGSWPALWAQSSANIKDRMAWNYFAEIDLMEACGNGGCSVGQNVSTKHKWDEGKYHSSSWG